MKNVHELSFVLREFDDAGKPKTLQAAPELLDANTELGSTRLVELFVEMAMRNSESFRINTTGIGDFFSQPEEVQNFVAKQALIELMRIGIVKNEFSAQLEDWYKIHRLFEDRIGLSSEEYVLSKDPLKDGIMVHYPWRREGALQPVLKKEEFNQVTYSRNLGLISPEAQSRLAKLKVVIVGAGVGGNIAKMLAMTGVQNFVIVDSGTIDLHNLNRVSYAGVPDLGINLAVLVAREIYELNPYANIETHDALMHVEGMPETGHDPKSNIIQFSDVVPGCDILIEGVDNLVLKYLIQMHALKSGLVTLMPSDLGMGANLKMVDTFPFNGTVKIEEILSQLTLIQAADPSKRYGMIVELAKRIIGELSVPPHMLEALKVAIGSNFGFFPQTGVAAALAASLVTERIVQLAEHRQSDSAKDITIDLRKK